MTTGEKIKFYRKEKKFTQKLLGELCGIAEPTIRKYESGRANPKWETVEKIASALGIPTSYILDMKSSDDINIESFLQKYSDASMYTKLKGLSDFLDISMPVIISKCMFQGLEVMKAQLAGREPKLIFNEVNDLISNERSAVNAEEDELHQ